MEHEGIEPAPRASKERLLRRVTQDLTGLPPSVEEIDAFLADEREEAYEEVVDRLLESEAFAERIAIDWMELSRYADSHGYHADGSRHQWPWRDWVIKAIDENMPYDEFVTWQLAGDLLPDATLEQRLATGFNRNHQMTAEGGIVEEEYRVEYVADRTNTTAKAFMGLTMECARCHDHKFDPVSQAEYYQLFAFFNNVDELGMTADDRNAGPLMKMFTEAQEDSLEQAQRMVQEALQAIEQYQEDVANSQSLNPGRVEQAINKGLVGYYPLEEIADETSPNNVPRIADANVSGEVDLVEGRVGKAAQLDYDYDYLNLEGVGLFEQYEPFSVGLWAFPEKKEAYAELFGNAGEKNSYWRGYEVFLDSLNRINARIIHALPHNYIHVVTNEQIPFDDWSHVQFTYDGSSKANGARIYIDGMPAPTEVLADNLYKTILPVNAAYKRQERPLRVGKSYRAFTGNDGIFTGKVDEIRVHDRVLTEIEVAYLAEKALDESPEQLHQFGLVTQDMAYQKLLDALEEARKEVHQAMSNVMEVMVMEERPDLRSAYVLDRGIYSERREEVDPGVPQAVMAFPEDLPRNRLGLAQWLFHEDNPLTARVAVNRYWQMLFGKGLVSTPEDFGYQGALPSHPALLDWLALEFVESGWDRKAFFKTVVLSSTYRQESTPRPELQELDPENILLAKGPSSRLPAEMIRDHALAVSGLLVDKIGGPSVKPYQPEGLWIDKGNFSPELLRYVPDEGEGLYRKSLYTFVRRTSPPPSMIAFDATDRSICEVRRQTTSTPMQALILLNDPQYVEASRKLAERMQNEGGDAQEEHLQYGFRLVTGRYPSDVELSLLQEHLRAEEQRFKQEPSQATDLLSVGQSPRNMDLDLTYTAALSVVASTMMNMDEAYMKR